MENPTDTEKEAEGPCPRTPEAPVVLPPGPRPRPDAGTHGPSPSPGGTRTKDGMGPAPTNSVRSRTGGHGASLAAAGGRHERQGGALVARATQGARARTAPRTPGRAPPSTRGGRRVCGQRGSGRCAGPQGGGLTPIACLRLGEAWLPGPNVCVISVSPTSVSLSSLRRATRRPHAHAGSSPTRAQGPRGPRGRGLELPPPPAEQGPLPATSHPPRGKGTAPPPKRPRGRGLRSAFRVLSAGEREVRAGQDAETRRCGRPPPPGPQPGGTPPVQAVSYSHSPGPFAPLGWRQDPQHALSVWRGGRQPPPLATAHRPRHILSVISTSSLAEGLGRAGAEAINPNYPPPRRTKARLQASPNCPAPAAAAGQVPVLSGLRWPVLWGCTLSGQKGEQGRHLPEGPKHHPAPLCTPPSSIPHPPATWGAAPHNTLPPCLPELSAPQGPSTPSSGLELLRGDP